MLFAFDSPPRSLRRASQLVAASAGACVRAGRGRMPKRLKTGQGWPVFRPRHEREAQGTGPARFCFCAGPAQTPGHVSLVTFCASQKVTRRRRKLRQAGEEDPARAQAHAAKLQSRSEPRGQILRYAQDDGKKQNWIRCAGMTLREGAARSSRGTRLRNEVIPRPPRRKPHLYNSHMVRRGKTL